MNQLRFLACVSVLIVLSISGCIFQDTQRYVQSTLVLVNQPYGGGCYRYDVKPGENLVLGMSRYWGVPLPHMVSGYSLYIEMNPQLLVKEANIKVPSDDAKAFLYVVPDKCTAKVHGALKIISLDDMAIWADVSLEAKDEKIDWSYNGSIEFKPSGNDHLQRVRDMEECEKRKAFSYAAFIDCMEGKGYRVDKTKKDQALDLNR